MSEAIINITLPGDPHKNNDRWLRAVCEDDQADTIRKAVTQMLRKPADYQIGSKRKVNPWGERTRKKTAAVVRGDEDAKVKGSLDELVEHAAT